MFLTTIFLIPNSIAQSRGSINVFIYSTHYFNINLVSYTILDVRVAEMVSWSSYSNGERQKINTNINVS